MSSNNKLYVDTYEAVFFRDLGFGLPSGLENYNVLTHVPLQKIYKSKDFYNAFITGKINVKDEFLNPLDSLKFGFEEKAEKDRPGGYNGFTGGIVPPHTHPQYLTEITANIWLPTSPSYINHESRITTLEGLLPVTHNDLPDLQGGQASPTKEYYHLTENQVNKLDSVEWYAKDDQDAEDVPIDPISGLSATNVQEALEEIYIIASDELEFIAQENISPFNIVTTDGFRANHTIVSHMTKILGFATSAVSTGFQGKAIGTGSTVVNGAWSYPVGTHVYLSTFGTFTTIKPITGFVVLLGSFISSNKLYIEIGTPIRLRV